MNHKKKFNHLSRTSAHRKAMLSNMAASLILNKRISTTVPKAKALKIYVEPLITKSKNDNTNSRRVVFSYLGQKEAVTELFSEVAPKIVNRPGGYTRILRTGNRIGDNAETCIIELVDFNATYTEVKQEVKKTTTRRRRSSGAKKAEATGAAVVEEAPKAEKGTKEEKKEKKPRKPRAKKEKEKEKAEATPELELPSTDKPVCPICHKGSILRGKTAYGCSEYKNGCTFRLDYATYGNNLTDEELGTVISKLKSI